MYKRKFKFLVLFLSSLPFCLLAQSKIGYIDSNQIMSRFDEVRGVQKELEFFILSLKGLLLRLYK